MLGAMESFSLYRIGKVGYEMGKRWVSLGKKALMRDSSKEKSFFDNSIGWGGFWRG